MNKHIDKKQIKACITMSDGTEVWVGVYATPRERLSDVVNDNRPFLPVRLLTDKQGKDYGDVYKMVLLNKSMIWRIEERK